MTLNGFTQILEQMPAVGNLDRLWQSLADGFSIFTGAVAGYNFNRGMLLEPLLHCLTVSFRQQINRFPPLRVNNNRAIAPSLAKGPIIDPYDPRGLNRWPFQVMK